MMRNTTLCLCKLLCSVIVFVMTLTFGVMNVAAQSSPILRLRPDGPLAPIHVLRFSADGRNLFAAGDDKLVQCWTLADGKFARDHTRSLRHPIGPGPLGTIRGMSATQDERYVVVGGIGTFDAQSGFTDDGILIPSFGWSGETLDQIGSVSLFDTQLQQLKRIKTHRGFLLAVEVVSLGTPAQTYLVTIGNDEAPRDCAAITAADETSVKRSLRVFRLSDVENQADENQGDQGQVVELARWSLADTKLQPELLVWTRPSDTNEATSQTPPPETQQPEILGLDDLRIAVSMADGSAGGGVDLFRLGKPEPVRFVDPFALSLDRIGETNQICVASRRGLSLVDGDSGKLIQRIDLTSQLTNTQFIFSLCTAKASPGIAAITLRDLGQPNSEHQLNVVDLQAGRLRISPGIRLGFHQNPVVATDPTGRFVAATADATAGLFIFDLQQLAGGTVTPMQVLRPDFLRIRRAALVSAGDEPTTLRFSMQSGNTTQTYDLIDDDLRPLDSPPWTANDTPLSFVKSTEKNEFVAKVSVAGSVVGTITIESSITPIAKMVQSKILGNRPLAAVSFVQHAGEAQPRLSLYDPRSGKELRRLSGHEQVVTGIEFSADHRRLTTVSSDGMVCVWKLDDLIKLVGGRGAIEDVKWCKSDAGLVISSIDSPLTSRGLKPGDLIIGLLDDAKSPDENGRKTITKIESPESLFLTLSRRKPGTDVSVRVRRDDQETDAIVRLGQAADERKPLFSFICAEKAGSTKPAWLAWTPGGPFQSSGPEIEELAGWHFNPENNGDPVSFAPFAQYREEFSGKALVNQLLANGRLPAVWPPQVKSSIAARFVDRRGEDIYPRNGRYQIAGEVQKMQVAVAGLPDHLVSGVVGHVDGGGPIEFVRSPDAPDLWETKADGFDFSVQHNVSVTVNSRRLRDGFQRESWDVNVDHPTLDRGNRVSTVKVIAPAAQTRLHQIELPDDGLIPIAAIVDVDAISEQYRFTVLRGDQPIELQEVQVVDNHLAAKVPVQIGENRFILQANNGAEIQSSQPFTVIVDGSPLIDSIAGQVKDYNRGRLELTVRSSRPPANSDFQVLIDGLVHDDWQIQESALLTSETTSVASTKPVLYRVLIDGLLLSPGEREIQVLSLDGLGASSTAPPPVTLVALAQPKQPVVKIKLEDGATFDSSRFDLAVQIESEDLKEALIRIGDEEVDLDLPQPDEDGIRSLVTSVPLQRGVNTLSITVVSDAGLMTTERRQVNRVERPVGIVAESFVSADSPAIPLNRHFDGTFQTIRSAAVARGVIEGYVRLSSDPSEVGAGAKVIRAWVNGFLQSVVPLKAKPDSDQLRFSIPVLLSATENRIRLDLPGLVESETSVASILAGCEQPSSDQTLHLMVISTRVSNQERRKFEQTVMELLGVKDHSMPAFSRVIGGGADYPALTGDFSRSDNVRELLHNCRLKLASQQGVNNTVLIYFHGDEVRSKDGRICLLTKDALPERAFSDAGLITSDYLGKQFEGLKCANLLFLDVAQSIASETTAFAGDPQVPGLGVLRLEQQGLVKRSSSPELLSSVNRVLPRISQIGQLASELEAEIRQASGLAINESIPQPIRWMRFGELSSP